MKKKTIHLFGLLLITSFSAWAQSSGPKSPTTSSTTGVGADFPSLGGFYVPSDFSVAYTDLADFPTCTNQFNCYFSVAANITGFGFTIPSTATITGIEVRLRKMISNPLPNIKDSLVQLLKAGNPVGLNYKNALQWPNTLTYVNYGDSTNLWGATWTPAEINDPNFGVKIIVQNTDFNQLAQYDHATVNVYYSLPNSLVELKVASELKLKITSDNIYILNTIETGAVSVNLYNLIGESIKSIPAFRGEAINTAGLRKGIYILQIRSATGVLSKRISLN